MTELGINIIDILNKTDNQIQYHLEEVKNKYGNSPKTINDLEPILDPRNATNDIINPVHIDIYEHMIKCDSAYWTSSEIPYDSELKDFLEFDKDIQYTIKCILSFFSKADDLVIDNLVNNFINEVQYKELIYLYTTQAHIENIHSQTYNKLLETIITETEEINEIKNNMYCNPIIIKKNDWYKKWTDPKKCSFVTRIIANAITEGIFFSSSFCFIYWLKTFGDKMKGLIKSNEFISKDERDHTITSIIIYNNKIVNKLTDEEIHTMFKEAVELEIQFINYSFKKDFEGMNKKLMCEYVKYVSDLLLQDLNHPKLYNSTNPFNFMENMNFVNKCNFFESIPSDYQQIKYTSTEYTEDF